MHPLLRATAERQLGLFTATDAHRAGYDHAEIRRLRSSGAWIALRRGVYATAEQLASMEEQRRRHKVACMAVLLELSRPTAAISHESAARLWGFPVRNGTAGPIRLTDPTLSRSTHGYKITQAPLRGGEVVRSGPLRLTGAARTLLDCCRQWPLDDAVVALDASLLAEKVTSTQLAEALATQRGWGNTSRAVRAVALADGRAESPLETLGRLRIVGSGLPTPVLQVEIRANGRLVGVVDGWFEEAAVAVEFDGQIKYTDPWRDRSPGQVLWEEKRREDELRALGIRVVRIADSDLDVRPWAVIEGRLRQLLASSAPGVRTFYATPRDRGRRRKAG